MKTILVATEKPFAPVAINQIKEVTDKAGYTLKLLEKYQSKDEWIQAAKEVDAMIIRSDKATDEVLSACENLKVIVRAGAGYDNIDLASATKNNIVAMNTPGQNSNAVAELVLGLMIYTARGFFNGKPGSELIGKNLGIHAFGYVGKLVAEKALAMKMKVFAFDPFIDKDTITSAGVHAVENVEDLYSKCDYISLHIPANEQTKNSIGHELLSKMPENSCLVNTARKEVIHEESILKMLESNRDFKYVSDIAPDNADLLKERFPESVFFTPKKMGAQTMEANINAGVAAAKQIIDFLENGNAGFRVN